MPISRKLTTRDTRSSTVRNLKRLKTLINAFKSFFSTIRRF